MHESWLGFLSENSD